MTTWFTADLHLGHQRRWPLTRRKTAVDKLGNHRHGMSVVLVISVDVALFLGQVRFEKAGLVATIVGFDGRWWLWTNI